MDELNKVKIRRSEIRERMNVIGGLEDISEAVIAEEKELRSEYQKLEVRQRAAEIGADLDDKQAKEAFQDDDKKGKELAELIQGASIGRIFYAAVERRATDGKEAEVQGHFKLSDNQIPLAMLRGPEHRALTAAPADVGASQAPIVPGVFPMSVGAFLGVDMPSVPSGDASFPVLVTNASVEALAESAGGTETNGSYSGSLLTPKRLQASFRYSLEDRARFSGMGESLRMNLNEALSDGLDKELISGTEGLLTGTKLDNHNVSAETTYELYRSQFAYGRVDGKYASTAKDLKVVMGSGTYAHAASQYRGNNDNMDALMSLTNATGGVKVSAHIPAAMSDKQNSVIRLGMRRDMVAPIWEGITLLEDPYTQKSKGEIVLTGVMLYQVKILRSDGFFKQQTQHA